LGRRYRRTARLPSQFDLTYAAFTLYSFDDQKRNPTVVKTDFQDLNYNFVDEKNIYIYANSYSIYIV